MEIAGSNPARVAIPSGARLAALIHALGLRPIGALTLVWGLALAGHAFAEDPGGVRSGDPHRRGPVEIRDGHLLAQARLTLPAAGPDTLGRGRWSAGASLLWSNSFSWTQDGPGEQPDDRRFLIDGETLGLDFSVRLGVAEHWDVGLRLPVLSRGGGSLDSFVDAWHRLLHLPDAERPLFLRDAFRFEAATRAGPRISWSDRAGTGLGDLELETRWRIRDGRAGGTSLGLLGRVSLPTGTGPFEGNGPAAGAQLVLATAVRPRVEVYIGAGATVQDPGPVRGVLYEKARGQAFVALEWRLGRRLSLGAETDVASRLVENIDAYPGLHWVVNLTGRLDLGRSLRLDLGLTENLEDQQSTTDLAFFLALAVRR